MKRAIACIGVTLVTVGLGFAVIAQTGSDSEVPSTRLPNGRNLSPITDDVYPQDYYPNTETLLTVINVTDEQVVVREAVVSELALPTGTTRAYLDAYRTPVDAKSKISEFLASERWKGFTPEPLPQK